MVVANQAAQLVLLSTDGCSLCDEALDLLTSMPELRGRALQVMDVAADELLLERYGPRLPVLLAGARQLDWPFAREDVAALLD